MTLAADFLVLGAGLAGLNAALRLAERGSVLLVAKGAPHESATAYAQGGIASVTGADDSFASHVSDTLAAGAGLCHADVVDSVVAAAPQAIERLVQLGVNFDKVGNAFDLTREGGHSARRVLHAQDLTGREIAQALRRRVDATANIVQLTDCTAVDLVTRQKVFGQDPNASAPDRCVGAYVLMHATQQVQAIKAKATLLATGGAGKVYLYTSNPDVATGDGVAMAFRAGATVANMEFFQFHPTCLYHAHAKSFLISEALRGEGGVLRRRDGTAFMKDLHPLADLAPRDVVARAIDAQMKRFGDDFVTLDMTHLDPAFIVRRFPNIHTSCLALGIDMTRMPVPVVPAAHYMCGGVLTDVRGKTDLLGLWAAGETACTGLHGANRLASNSLLEAAVVSERAASDMAYFAQHDAHSTQITPWDTKGAQDPDEMVVVSHNWDELRRIMWNYVGIVRSDKRLARAAQRVKMLQAEINEYYWSFLLTRDLLELRNLLVVARLIIACAQKRRESRGLHYNLDTPEARGANGSDTKLRCGPHDTLIFADV